ncbi:phosphomannomutase/phosphoglucomutase [Myxococcota bacterium]|nr:phosphomannomutase/phosphoglucomutase [Myxococcota bacterium]MBU1537242.1 phosphomannomutase/phosphoglucomutase [Myxococcota bacterium]
MADPFHAYDIRGIYNETVTEDVAYKVGRSYCRLFQPSRVVVGRDMRASSDPLAEALISGLRLGGCAVSDMGLASTDMMYLAVISHGFDGGFMVTASHNPAAYNGIKIVGKGAVPMGLGTGLERIATAVEGMKPFPTVPFQAARSEFVFLDEYTDLLLTQVDTGALARIPLVIDAGNGMGGYAVDPLISRLDLKVERLYFEPDGSFPHHEANPLINENRRDLEARVAGGSAQLGVGLDGDADRAFFVDDEGHFASGDLLVGILAGLALAKEPGAPITYCVRSSRFTQQRILDLGGVPHMVKVGHAYAKKTMAEINAPFGGEVSGHYYYRFNGCWYDSGPLTILKMLEVLGKNECGLKTMLEPTRDYFLSGEINSTVEEPQAVMDRIDQAYASFPNRITIDGLRIESDDWWFSVRRSNTEPLFRLNCEGRTQSVMERIRDEVLSLIRS